MTTGQMSCLIHALNRMIEKHLICSHYNTMTNSYSILIMNTQTDTYEIFEMRNAETGLELEIIKTVAKAIENERLNK